jgi:RNA-directed DNA polymerase
MKVVRKHTDCKWIILYIERWLKAPFQKGNGEIVERTSGTPQGGVISPVLANLFLHYAFDKWMEKNHPNIPWVRYADDGLAHCQTRDQAEKLLKQLRQRFRECKLELHPEKTQIVYCKDDDRKEDHPEIKFDFLGYTFRPRRSKNRFGKFFINFTPAVSNKAGKAMRQVIRNWRIHLKPDKEIDDIARIFDSVIRGWINYYGRFYKSQLYSVLRHMNQALVYWARKKYKKLSRGRRRAERWLGKLAKTLPHLFSHWKMGILPTAG